MMRVYEIKSSSRNAFEKRIEAAKTSTLRLTNAKQILDIEHTDLKLLLSYNPEFFDHCMKVADKVVAQITRISAPLPLTKKKNHRYNKL